MFVGEKQRFILQMLGPPVSTSFLLFCFVSLFPVGSLKNKKSSNIAKGVKELMI